MHCQWSSWMWRGSTWWKNSFMQSRLEVRSSFILFYLLTLNIKILAYIFIVNFKSLNMFLLFLFFSAGIDEQGLYRIAGVNSRVQKLLSLAMGTHNTFHSLKIKMELMVLLVLTLWRFVLIRSKDLRWRGAGKPWVGDQDHHKCYQALSQVG